MIEISSKIWVSKEVDNLEKVYDNGGTIIILLLVSLVSHCYSLIMLL